MSTSIREVAGITFELRRKRMKNMRLRVTQPDGLVVVSAPPRMPLSEVDAFVASRAEWIAEQRDKIDEHPRDRLRSCVSGETLSVWGDIFTLEVEEGPRMSLELGDDGIARMRAPISALPEERRAWLREWYRDELKREVERVMPEWVERTGLVPAEWRSKWMKTRWGTCATKARRIWLNVQLAKFPPRYLDYVIVHELCHLEVANHGPAFYELMDRFMPGWQKLRRELNRWELEYTE